MEVDHRVEALALEPRGEEPERTGQAEGRGSRGIGASVLEQEEARHVGVAAQDRRVALLRGEEDAPPGIGIAQERGDVRREEDVAERGEADDQGRPDGHASARPG